MRSGYGTARQRVQAIASGHNRRTIVSRTARNVEQATTVGKVNVGRQCGVAGNTRERGAWLGQPRLRQSVLLACGHQGASEIRVGTFHSVVDRMGAANHTVAEDMVGLNER